MNRPESFEQACEMLGLNPTAILPDVSTQPEWLKNQTIANTKRLVIAAAVREGKLPTAADERWFGVFDLRPSSFGFSHSYTYFDDSHSTVGLRLEFFTEEESDYFNSNFTDLHRAALIGG